MFRGDSLIFFRWDYTAAAGPMLTAGECGRYEKVVHGLETDYGPYHHKRACAYDARIDEYFWRLPRSSGHTTYGMGKLTFQIANNGWLDDMYRRTHNR